MADRVILHSDLNNFYASVECMLDPKLKTKFVAVCGNQEERHGIVLAKNQKAKEKGVRTGETIWQAKQKCPWLVVVPPHYEEYLKYSRLVHDIYSRYTDLIEPFGIDECWLDVTGSQLLFGTGCEIADEIRAVIRKELDLTVSVGVSYNKVFAKLGSDLKKPDATTEILRETFQKQIWGLPVSDLLGVGRATAQTLRRFYIRTIGQLAATPPDTLQRRFGVRGVQLWRFANGMDEARVMPKGFQVPIKSIGHGITCTEDLMNNEEVWKVFLELSQNIAHRLRLNRLLAAGVQISVRDNALFTRQFQAKLPRPSHLYRDIAGLGQKLFEQHFHWEKPVRSLTIRAIDLVSENIPRQIDLFQNPVRAEKKEALERVVDEVCTRFGARTVVPARLLGDLKMPEHQHESIMPGIMYQ